MKVRKNPHTAAIVSRIILINVNVLLLLSRAPALSAHKNCNAPVLHPDALFVKTLMAFLVIFLKTFT